MSVLGRSGQGLSDPTAVLDAITATVDELCACGCGRSLAGSPSAWFATPGCQRQWQAARAGGQMRDGGRLAGEVLPGWADDRAGPGGGSSEAGRAGAWNERQPPPVRPVRGAGGEVVGLQAQLGEPVSAHYETGPDGRLLRVVFAGQGLAGEAHALWSRLVDQGQALLVAQDLATAAERAGLPAGLVFAYDTTPLVDRVGEAFGALRAGMQMYGEAVSAAVAGIGQAMQWLEERGVLDPSPPAATGPDGVRERALWLRQHRNTGPAQRVRAPRRLDPHGGAPRRG